MKNNIEINGKKYQKMCQDMYGYKEHIDKEGNLIREPYVKPLKIVPYDKTVIIEGELFAEVDDFSKENLV